MGGIFPIFDYLFLAIFMLFPLLLFYVIQKHFKNTWWFITVIVLGISGYILVNGYIRVKILCGWMPRGPEVGFAMLFAWLYMPVFTLLFYGPLYLLSLLIRRIGKFSFGETFSVTSTIAVLLIIFCVASPKQMFKGHTEITPYPPNSSIPDLLKNLPNLTPFEVGPGNYAIIKSKEPTRDVPSPSDIKLELRCSIQLSDRGYKMLKSDYDWHVIQRTDIPKDLADMIPGGTILASPKFNETFNTNPGYAEGLAVILADDDSNSLFISAKHIR